MTMLSDRQIRNLSLFPDSTMISPFEPNKVKVDARGNKILSWGSSSFGYDIRLGEELYVYTNRRCATLDPLDFDRANYDKVDVQYDSKGLPYVMIPPNGFLLGHSVEVIKVPRDVLVLVLSKSTYARLGNICIATPLEPAWEGQVTLEFANTAPTPSKMYIGQGCAQLVFLRSDDECEADYVDSGGKYQHQVGVVFPKG